LNALGYWEWVWELGFLTTDGVGIGGGEAGTVECL